MNILFVTGQFASNARDCALGGMARSVFKSAVGLQGRGHSVRILTADRVDRRWIYQGIPVISVTTRFDIKGGNDIRFLWDILSREYILEKKIWELHAEEPIDIIQYTGWFGIGLFHDNKIPAVMRISSYTRAEFPNEFSRSRYRILSKLELFAAKRMNFVFTPGKNVALAVEKDLHKKVAVIETPYISEKVDSSNKNDEFEIADKRYVLFFGRLSIEKGIYVIDKVLYRMLKQFPDIYFVFAGLLTVNQGEPIKERLEKSAAEFKERLIFCGVVPQEELVHLIQGAEVILMPSIMDNFPNTCAEAMDRGKIVIGTDGSSLEQFIIDGHSGLLAKPGDSESLYRKFLQAMALSEAEKKRIERNAQRRVKKWNLEDYSAKMESLYERVILLRK